MNNASLDTVVHGVYIDSRKVEENGLYIPIIGERVDGHTFIKNIEDKAALTLCSNEAYIPENIACIVVEDTVKALQELAKNYRQTLDATVIGITGSNGKTSCKDILAGCLSAKYKTQKTQGNHNNEIGVPLTDGYNGNLTSKQNGSVGGYMVKKMIEAQERQMADKGSM